MINLCFITIKLYINICNNIIYCIRKKNLAKKYLHNLIQPWWTWSIKSHILAVDYLPFIYLSQSYTGCGLVIFFTVFESIKICTCEKIIIPFLQTLWICIAHLKFCILCVCIEILEKGWRQYAFFLHYPKLPKL